MSIIVFDIIVSVITIVIIIISDVIFLAAGIVAPSVPLSLSLWSHFFITIIIMLPLKYPPCTKVFFSPLSCTSFD